MMTFIAVCVGITALDSVIFIVGGIIRASMQAKQARMQREAMKQLFETLSASALIGEGSTQEVRQ